MYGEFSHGNWTEPEPTVSAHNYAPSPARGIFNDIFQHPDVDQQGNLDDEVSFLARTPAAQRRPTTPASSQRSKSGVTFPPGAAGESPQSTTTTTKISLSAFLNKQIAVRRPGEQVIDEIASNVVMTDTP